VIVDDPPRRPIDAWLVARCIINVDHDAPDENCTCGFYGVKSLPMLERLLWGARVSIADSETVTYPVAGRVDLAGKIVEHNLGYRAERMRIAELLPFHGAEEIVARFARSLRVPAGEPIAEPAPPAALAQLLSLTSRDVQVMQMLSVDGSCAEIARRLYVAPKTVRTHIKRMLTKLGVHSVLEAVAFGTRYGLVSPPSPPGATPAT